MVGFKLLFVAVLGERQYYTVIDIGLMVLRVVIMIVAGVDIGVVVTVVLTAAVRWHSLIV